MLELASTRELTHRIAGYGLAEDEPSIVLRDGEWRSLMTHLKVERLSGIAWAAANAGVLVLEEGQVHELRELHVADMSRTLALERALLGIARSAEEEGLDFIVLKGPALAHRFYPDPSWRAFGDIDLLVRTSDWRRACALLEACGFHRALPEPRAGFDERFGKAAVHVNERGLNVDLHRTLVLGSFGLWMQPEELFDRTIPFDVAGIPLRRLDDTALMLHACVHAALGFKDPLLMPLRDVVQIAASGAVDWDVLREWAARWKLSAVVGHAFADAERILGFEAPPEVAAVRAARVGRRERRALGAYTTDRRIRGGTARSSFWAVPGIRQKAVLLRAVLLPDQAFLQARTKPGARPSYLRRWAVPIRWLLRRR